MNDRTWPRRVEVLHTVPEDHLDSGWISIDYHLTGAWPAMSWYAATAGRFRFAVQDRRVLVSVDEGPWVLAGVMLGSSDDVPVLERELAHARQRITVWSCRTQFPALAELANLENVISLLIFHSEAENAMGSGLPHCFEHLGLLERFPQLTSLCLGFIDSTQGVESIAKLKRLRALRLASSGTVDLAPLRSLRSLRHLALSCDFENLSVLSELPEFESLTDQYGTLGAEFAQLAPRCRQLKRLHLPGGSSTRTLHDLAFPRDLRALSVHGAAIDDLSALTAAPNLVHLDLEGNSEPLGLWALKGLTGLRSLNLRDSCVRGYGPFKHFNALRSLQVPPEITDEEVAAIVTGCPRLESLTLPFCPQIRDLSPLGKLRHLRELYILGCDQVNDLGFLTELPNLERLRPDVGSEVADYSPLRSLTSLTELEVRPPGRLRNLSVLERMTELKTLRLVGQDSLDLAPLRNLKNLVRLDYSLRGSVDLRPLADLPNLVFLEIDCDRISHLWEASPESVLTRVHFASAAMPDLGKLASLKRLEAVEFSYCSQLRDLAPLAKIPNLRYLKLLFCTGTTDFSPLARAPRLRTLEIAFEPGERVDLSSLGSLQQLEYLRIDGDTEAAPMGETLEKLAGLVGLRLEGCESLTDLEPLSALQNLRYLDLTGCSEIEDFSPLIKLRDLRGLSVAYTEVDDVSFVRRLPNLVYLKIHGCNQLEDIKPLDKFMRRGGFVDIGWGERLHAQLEQDSKEQ